jgi:type I restriction enzyme R subunit
MRPINSMIEFKQIIGRGTRLYEDKEYFTIYDFVQAHHHFNDPEWDGEPIAPEPAEPNAPGHEASPSGRVTEKGDEYQPRSRVKVQLADGKDRAIQDIVVTTFWHTDGTPMTAQQFMEMLFGKLPEFFKSEAELRQLWCAPATRADLLRRLTEKGFGAEQLAEMQRIIDAENSDLFDVLAFVAYALPTVTRLARAGSATTAISAHFNTKQRAFIDFVLTQYVQVGVEELASDKLAPLLKLKYHNALADAVADIGQPDEISKVFVGFQKFLYQLPSAA